MAILTIRKLFVLISQEFLLILLPTPLQNKSEPRRENKEGQGSTVLLIDNILVLALSRSSILVNTIPHPQFMLIFKNILFF